MSFYFSTLVLISLSLMGCSTLRTPDYQTKGRHVINNHLKRSPASLGSSRIELIWPVTKAQVSQYFAPKKNRKHDGIDIRGSKNTPIRAAHTGRVIYAGRKYSGYGKMILLASGGQVSTLYAHLNKYYVKNGQRVKRGQVIGTMGRTGRASGVHLHFEVLKKKIPVDPISLLP